MVRNNRDYSKYDIYTKIFGLFVSTLPTWLILNFTKLKANHITFLGLVGGTSGAVLAYLFGIQYLLIGFLIFYTLDFVDGNVAIARGGGSFFGTIFDLLTDRIVLMLCTLVLAEYHISSNQPVDVILLIGFTLSFLFVDIIGLSFYTAKDQFGRLVPKETVERKVNNSFSEILSDIEIWIPTRVSSYLFIIGAYFYFEDFKYAYLAGIIAIFLSVTRKLFNVYMKDVLHK